MNYIKRLEASHSASLDAVSDALGEIISLRSYLTSSKFNCGNALDGYVNVNDVLARLVNVSNTLVEYSQDWGTGSE